MVLKQFDHQKFQDYFPKLLNNMQSWRPDIKSLNSDEAVDKFFEIEVDAKLQIKENQEIMAIMKEEWTTLYSMNDGFVAVHTMLVLWRAACCLPELYNPLNEQQQNAILWACLLHDMRKLSSPVI